MVDYGYGQELQEKLPTLPPAAVKTVAARVALQWLPNIFRFFEQGSDRTDFQQFLLLCLRACVVSGLEGTRPNPEVIALNAYLNSSFLSTTDTGSLLNFLPKSASIASNAIRIATNEVDTIISNLPSHLTAYQGEGLNERTADTATLTIAPEDTEQVFATELWYGAVPEPFASFSRQFFDNATGTPWAFWAEWYERMLHGKPMDWELQRRVAMIEDSIWTEGPDAVSKEIAEIQARWEVEKALSDIKGSLTVRTSARHGIGGNNPPESIEDERLSGPISWIWEATEELSTALEEERPARERIEAILGKLKAGLTDLLKWSALTVKLAVGTVVVISAKKFTTAVVDAYIVKHPEKIEALIKAIEEWLPLLS